MSKYEERAFKVGKTTSNLSDLKNQLGRLKADLEQFVARKPDGAVVAPLRERIRALEAEIAAGDESRKRDQQAGKNARADAADALAGDAAGSLTGRFPPRRR